MNSSYIYHTCEPVSNFVCVYRAVYKLCYGGVLLPPPHTRKVRVVCLRLRPAATFVVRKKVKSSFFSGGVAA